MDEQELYKLLREHIVETVKNARHNVGSLDRSLVLKNAAEALMHLNTAEARANAEPAR